MANPAIVKPSSAQPWMRWSVLGLLTVAIIIAYVDRINLSSALPEMRKTFPLTPQASGILLSAFFWSYAALQPPAGWIIDRYGVKWPYAIAFFIWSLVSAATAMVSTLGGLIAVRILLGVGESVVTPASMRYIRTNFAEKERGLAIGIYMSGSKYGPAIGAPLAAYLISGYGWQLMFLLTGLGCLLWLIPWVVLAPNDAGIATSQSDTASKTPASWRAILSTPVMWGTCVATFCYMYFVYFCMTWMPTYFKERHGLSLTNSGWFTFMSFGGMATMAILGGWAADRLIGKGYNPVTVRKTFVIAGFVLAFSEIIGAFTESASLTLFLAVFSLSGLGLTTANYWAVTQTLMPGGAIGRVAGLQNTAASVAGIAAPWITGSLVQKTGNFNAPLMTIGFWLAVGVGCYLFLVREKYALR
jgi:ACS family D-galactonate transporter-like MFS transporter